MLEQGRMSEIQCGEGKLRVVKEAHESLGISGAILRVLTLSLMMNNFDWEVEYDQGSEELIFYLLGRDREEEVRLSLDSFGFKVSAGRAKVIGSEIEFVEGREGLITITSDGGTVDILKPEDQKGGFKVITTIG